MIVKILMVLLQKTFNKQYIKIELTISYDEKKKHSVYEYLEPL